MIPDNFKKSICNPHLQDNWRHMIHALVALLFVSILCTQGCVAVSTFPTIARPGDTISIMIGGSELARKNTLSASLWDANGTEWRLRELGLIRSVFNLRPDGRAYGLHYPSFFDIESSWVEGHEPMQTVMVINVPESAAFGNATLQVNLDTTDDSSAVAQPFSISLDIVDIPGKPGTEDQFLRQNWNGINEAVILTDLEPAPYAKISFGEGDLGGFKATPDGVILGAATLVVDFNEAVISGDDLTVYVAESTQRSSASASAPFGLNTQRNVVWQHDGNKLTIQLTTPMGIKDNYLQLYVIHPRNLTGDPALNLISSAGYDLNGNAIFISPRFTYHP